MNKDFKILSVKEEQKLSKEELKEYYKELREYVLERKLTNTTPGITTIAPKLKKPVEKVAIKLVKFFTNKNVKWKGENWVCDGLENIPDGPVIFAHTHQGLLDNFVWMPEVNKHSPILHSIDASKILLYSEYTTGLILVKKGDKENNKNAKLDMINLLLNGLSITYFPESAWNLSPNKLHLPLSFGVIDVAKKAGVPIVPVVHEYTYDTSLEKENILKVHSRYAKPIYVSFEDDLIEKLHEYEEVISTIRYDLISEKGLFKRSEISSLDYINYLKGNYKNLEFGKIDINNERNNLFNINDEFYKFNHINDVSFNEEGELLETEHVRKIKSLDGVKTLEFLIKKRETGEKIQKNKEKRKVLEKK